LRIATLVAAISTLTALVLSVLGLFCAQVDVERQYTRELAIYIALGVPRWGIALRLLRKILKIACIGAGIGVAVSFALLRILASNVGVLNISLRTWLIAPMIPMAVALIASALPTSLAFRANTSKIMRDDS
jgi:putative ABC transport system permease protein